MRFVNVVVIALLRSPLHRLLSSSVCVIRYRGRRSARSIAVPTQYARHGDELIVVAGGPEKKSWWRNFRTEHDAEMLLRGCWVPVRGCAFVGADEPGSVADLLHTYIERFPRAERAIGRTPADIDAAVVIRFVPR